MICNDWLSICRMWPFPPWLSVFFPDPVVAATATAPAYVWNLHLRIVLDHADEGFIAPGIRCGIARGQGTRLCSKASGTTRGFIGGYPTGFGQKVLGLVWTIPICEEMLGEKFLFRNWSDWSVPIYDPVLNDKCRHEGTTCYVIGLVSFWPSYSCQKKCDLLWLTRSIQRAKPQLLSSAI